MSANSVLPPHDGTTRADSREYLAGTSAYELSECHSRSPSLKNHWRSSAEMILPSLSRFERSPMPAPSRLSDALRMLPGRALTSSSPKLREKAICCSSVMFWS